MGRLIETVGKYAEIPYYIEQTGTCVFCAEELCFVLCRDAFLLDEGILCEELIKWLDTQCGLEELSKSLYALLHQNASPGAAAGTILEYVNYGTEGERKRAEELFRKSAGMDVSDRKKNHADYLVSSGRYVQAVREYDEILEQFPAITHSMRARLLHNKGVALCRLFAFEEAACAFLEAYQEEPENDESGICYLGVLRMNREREEYISFIAEHKIWQDLSLELEGRITACQEAFKASEEYHGLMELQEKKESGSKALYYDEIVTRLAAMKEKYREMTAES